MLLTNEIKHFVGGDFFPYIPIQDFIAVMIWYQKVLNDPFHIQNRVGKNLDDMSH